MSLLLRFRCPGRHDGCSASAHPAAVPLPADGRAATSWMAHAAVVVDGSRLLHRHVVLQLPLVIRLTGVTPRRSRAPTSAVKIAIQLQPQACVGFPSAVVVPLLLVCIPRW